MAPIEVIYEDGVLRPLTPVELQDGDRLEVILVRRNGQQVEGSSGKMQYKEPLVGEELAKLLETINSLPYTPHLDGRTDLSTSYREILYPKDGDMP